MNILRWIPSSLAMTVCAGILTAGTDGFEYTAALGKLPPDASPIWGRRFSGGGSVQIQDSQLVGETRLGQKAFFVIGRTDAGETHGQSDAWNGAAGTATVDFRVQCHSDDPDFEIFQVQLSDGKAQWRIRFFNNRVYPQGKSINPTEPDTYRATMKDGQLTLTSARSGLIFKDLPGGEPYSKTPEQQGGDCLWFGSFSTNSSLAEGKGRWSLDFIRWTNNAANFDPPENPQGSADNANQETN